MNYLFLTYVCSTLLFLTTRINGMAQTENDSAIKTSTIIDQEALYKISYPPLQMPLRDHIEKGLQALATGQDRDTNINFIYDMLKYTLVNYKDRRHAFAVAIELATQEKLPLARFLHRATIKQDYEMVKKCFDCGADPQSCYPDDTPIYTYINNCQIFEAYQIACKDTFDVSRLLKKDKTMLHKAMSQRRSPQLLARLLENGLNPDSQDAKQRTPLHYVALILQKKMLTDTPFEVVKQKTESLILAGANVVLTDKNSYTPLMSILACRSTTNDEYYFQQIVELLEQAEENQKLLNEQQFSEKFLDLQAHATNG